MSTTQGETLGRSDLDGRNVLIVGASSGIGESLARQASLCGAAITVCGRRLNRLEELIEGVGAGHAIAGDATSQPDMTRVVDEAAAAMGGIDLIVYAAGFGTLQPMSEFDGETWMDHLHVNAFGANNVCRAALDHVGANGLIAVISSRGVSDCHAFLGPYSVSKAALDQCVRMWRAEHPDRRFMRVVMGNTHPTEFAADWDATLFERALVAWEKQGIPGGLMPMGALTLTMVRTFATLLDHPEIDCTDLVLDARPDPSDEEALPPPPQGANPL